jgi:glutathione S-transferase
VYKLFNVKGWGSMGVQFLLEEMGVAYDNVWMTAEQVRDPAFRNISPLGFIPALELPDGRSLFESAAIFSYLATAHPDVRLSPRPGTYDFGVYLSWLQFMSANIYPVTNMAYGGGGYSESDDQTAIIKRKAAEVMQSKFEILNARLKSEGPWLFGKSFSGLDLYLFMLTIWGMPSEAETHAKFKKIAKLCESVRGRPKLQAALAAHGVNEIGSYNYP